MSERQPPLCPIWGENPTDWWAGGNSGGRAFTSSVKHAPLQSQRTCYVLYVLLAPLPVWHYFCTCPIAQGARKVLPLFYPAQDVLMAHPLSG